MRTLLELIRIIFLFFIVVGIITFVKNLIYLKIGITAEKYVGFGFIAAFLLFFVIYRNKWQFSGWYQGKGKQKLPKKLSKYLVLSAIFLLLLPPVLNLFP